MSALPRAAAGQADSVVLVVDDEPRNRFAMREILRGQPLELLEASSGIEALQVLLRREVALILLDVQMPGMDGFECARMIRQSPVHADTPIVFVTAFARTGESIDAGFRAGAVDYLTKPFDVALLRNKVTILLELSARRRELRRQAERLESVFAMSPDGFITVDADGAIVALNPAAAELLGLPDGALLGGSLPDLEHWIGARGPADSRGPVSLAAAFGPPTAEGLAGLTLELAVPRWRMVQVVGRRMRSGASLLCLRDVTREVEVARMKSEFVSTAAHELRTPMTSVFGYAELMLSGRVGGERLPEMAAVIHRHCGRMIQILDEMLDLARIEARRELAFAPEHVMLEPLLARLVADSAPGDVQRLALVFAAGALPAVVADPERLLRALGNLVSNALRYSSANLPVRVGAAPASRRGRAGVAVEIRDRGIGMSAGELARLGEPFFRADASCHVPGTGLGVTISREIVSAHDGELTFESMPGQGTSATVWLPALA